MKLQFSTYDANKDGKLGYDEFLNWWSTVVDEQEASEKFKKKINMDRRVSYYI